MLTISIEALHLVNPISENGALCSYSSLHSFEADIISCSSGTCSIVAISRSPTERLDHPKDLRTSYMSWLIMWKPEDNLSKLDDVFGISITPALRSEFKGISVIESSQLWRSQRHSCTNARPHTWLISHSPFTRIFRFMWPTLTFNKQNFWDEEHHLNQDLE